MSEDAHISDILPELQAAMRAVAKSVVPELADRQHEYLVDSLLDVAVNTLAGLRVLVPAARQARQAADVQRLWTQGRTARQISQELGVSLATAYRHHPNRRNILSGDHEMTKATSQGTRP